ncbi:MAG: NAD-dependent deacylase [bacterium]|nr:NAD-dependent deacylase [bacterium]
MFSQAAITALRAARHLAVLTGAGVSAESGVPTFRGAGGLWRNHDALSLATPEAFARDPKLVWEFYNYRREVLAPLDPNPGHYALVALEKKLPGFSLITQNIDNLHRIAGGENLFELHGNIWQIRCTDPRCENTQTPIENRQVPIEPLPPRCGKCGALMRPNIVWFGEMLDGRVLRSALAAVSACDFFIVAGTSAAVQPAASMPIMARQAGAFVIEINPEETALSALVNESLQSPSGTALPRLFEAAFGG